MCEVSGLVATVPSKVVGGVTAHLAKLTSAATELASEPFTVSPVDFAAVVPSTTDDEEGMCEIPVLVSKVFSESLSGVLAGLAGQALVGE